MRLLFVAIPIEELGSPNTGGVSNAIFNAKKALKNYQIDILAPGNSDRSINIKGTLQPSLIKDGKNLYPILPDSVIANQWEWIRERESEYDFIINFANDWLPYYLTSFFETPILHRANASETNLAVNDIIKKIDTKFPNQVACLSKAQAKELELKNYFHLKQGLDLDIYEFNDSPSDYLVWAGRISPEKGLEDACEAARQAGKKLKICGFIQDKTYWQKIISDYKNIEYIGMLTTNDLQKVMGNSQALLFTSKWVEAFGQVIIESLACGTPVISYDCGSPAEIIEDNKTGYVVKNIEEMSKMISLVENIDRKRCRDYAQKNHNLLALQESYQEWFDTSSKNV